MPLPLRRQSRRILRTHIGHYNALCIHIRDIRVRNCSDLPRPLQSRLLRLFDSMQRYGPRINTTAATRRLSRRFFDKPRRPSSTYDLINLHLANIGGDLDPLYVPASTREPCNLTTLDF